MEDWVRRSIWSRKRDLVYFVFFVTHLPIMLAADLTDYYPAAVKPHWMTALREWYVATYGDRFFYDPPIYFSTLTFLELTLLLPLTIALIPALWRDAPRTPLLLLVFGLECSVTTLVCLVEMRGWAELSDQQRGLQGLGGMYGGYLVLGVLMTVDAWFRVDRALVVGREVGKGKKKAL